MIALIRGVVAARQGGSVVVDCAGVGYLVSVSEQSLVDVPGVGADVSLHTHMVVRDDAMQLYGFSTVEERELFLLLVTVPSVGPKLALAVTGSAPTDALGSAIASGDAQRLQSIPGIGKRTAERICLDLKDSLGAFAGIASASTGSIRSDARDALLGLGMAEREVEQLLDEVEGSTAEEIIQAALRVSKQR